MVSHVRFQASDLLSAVGIDAPGGKRRSDGRAGHICYGPYLTLSPGSYAAGFYLRREAGDDEGAVDIEAVTEHGRRVLGRRSVPVRELFSSLPGLIHVDFTLDAVERSCEMRLHVPARCAVEVSEAVLFRTDLMKRGAA